MGISLENIAKMGKSIAKASLPVYLGLMGIGLVSCDKSQSAIPKEQSRIYRESPKQYNSQDTNIKVKDEENPSEKYLPEIRRIGDKELEVSPIDRVLDLSFSGGPSVSEKHWREYYFTEAGDKRLIQVSYRKTPIMLTNLTKEIRGDFFRGKSNLSTLIINGEDIIYIDFKGGRDAQSIGVLGDFTEEYLQRFPEDSKVFFPKRVYPETLGKEYTPKEASNLIRDREDEYAFIRAEFFPDEGKFKGNSEKIQKEIQGWIKEEDTPKERIRKISERIPFLDLSLYWSEVDGEQTY